jgi:hypothetical protein
LFRDIIRNTYAWRCFVTATLSSEVCGGVQNLRLVDWAVVGWMEGELIYILNMSEDFRVTQPLIQPRWNFIFKVKREREREK